MYIQQKSRAERSSRSKNITSFKYDKQDQQGKAVFNERSPQTTEKQQEPVAMSTGEP
jgi:hypothetical protein